MFNFFATVYFPQALFSQIIGGSYQTQQTYKDQVLYCFGLMKFEAGESIKKTV